MLNDKIQKKINFKGTKTRKLKIKITRIKFKIKKTILFLIRLILWLIREGFFDLAK